MTNALVLFCKEATTTRTSSVSQQVVFVGLFGLGCLLLGGCGYTAPTFEYPEYQNARYHALINRSTDQTAQQELTEWDLAINTAALADVATHSGLFAYVDVNNLNTLVDSSYDYVISPSLTKLEYHEGPSFLTFAPSLLYAAIGLPLLLGNEEVGLGKILGYIFVGSSPLAIVKALVDQDAYSHTYDLTCVYNVYDVKSKMITSDTISFSKNQIFSHASESVVAERPLGGGWVEKTIQRSTVNMGRAQAVLEEHAMLGAAGKFMDGFADRSGLDKTSKP